MKATENTQLASHPRNRLQVNQTLSRVARAQSTHRIATESLISQGFQEQGGELEYQVWLETLDVISRVKRGMRP